MTILPPLKDNTIRLLKYECDKKTISILECDTQGALQTDKNDLVTYSVSELTTTQTTQEFSDNFKEISPLLASPLEALFKEKSEMLFDELDGMVQLVRKAMRSNYKTSDKYPLLAIVDELIPWEITLTNLADEQQPLVSLDLS